MLIHAADGVALARPCSRDAGVAPSFVCEERTLLDLEELAELPAGERLEVERCQDELVDIAHFYRVSGVHTSLRLHRAHRLYRLLDVAQIAVVELETAREFFPELDLLSVEKLGVLQFVALVCLDLHVYLVLGFLDEAIVVLEIQVDLSGELGREGVESLS